MLTTRFAPSPTGALHLGHAWSAVLAHDRARAADGRFLLRIEDIDGARSRPEHVAGILADLEWLGLAWDGPVLFQSTRLGAYAAALDQLRACDLLYPCFCTRTDIAREVAASLSAPHGPDGVRYPGTCRALDPAERVRRIAAEPHAWRIDMARATALVG
ncbi:MAG: tRNA glutamyl-Q(34) synthetase GluQRS, partial [Sphingomonas sp.]|nr:tRNA glutamyl-Q(34) synthetase GluQRS [Sphingomonas sp.]